MRTCFFIRPFSPASAGNEDPAIFDSVCRAVRSAVGNAGIRLVDPTEDQRAGTIIEHVRKAIDDADVIVALVTGGNPNVFYELGRARRDALILVRSAGMIPFDIRQWRYWEYGGVSESALTARLHEALKQTLAMRPAGRRRSSKIQIERFFATPLATVAESNIYDLLGVWRSMEAPTDSYEPPYVPRTCDSVLERAFATCKIAIVNGPAKAGKTRSAAHALRNVAHGKTLLVPRRGLFESLPGLIQLAAKVVAESAERAFILWLDEIDKYLRASLLEPRDVDALSSHQALSVVGTINSRSLLTLRTSDDDYAKAAQILLSRAEIIELPGEITENERQAARVLYPDLPLGPSLGESFIAAPQLRARLDAVDDDSVASLAIARAAIDLQRLGLGASTRLEVLRSLHRAYVLQLNPQTIYDAASFESGIREALKPVARNSALLMRDPADWREDRFSVPDFLEEHIERRGEALLPAAWSWAIDHVDTGSMLSSLGTEASRRGETEWTRKAWQRGASLDHGMSAFKLGRMLYAEDPGTAEQYLRQATQLGVRRASLVLASLFKETGHAAQAIEILENELERGSLRAAVMLCSSYYADTEHRTDYERVCRRSIELGSAWHALELGSRFLRQGATDEGIALLVKGLDWCRLNYNKLIDEGREFGADREMLADAAFGVLEEQRYRSDLAVAFQIGRLLESVGAAAEAERAYRFLHAQQSLAGSLDLTRLLFNSGRIDEARSLARELADSASIVERLLRGEGFPRPSREVFGLTVLTLSRNNPESTPEFLLSAGELFHRLDQASVAAALWQAGTDRGSAECAWQLAQLLQKDRTKFEPALRVAVDLGSARAAGTLGILCLERGEAEEAERLLRLAVKSSEPEIIVTARFRLGVLFHRQQRVPEAEAEYRWIIQNGNNVTAAEAAANLGNMLAAIPARMLDAAQAYVMGIDRGSPECAHFCRQKAAELFDALLPTLITEDGQRLLFWATTLNRHQIATPSVLAGIVAGAALTGQFDAAREHFDLFAARHLDGAIQILEREIAANSAAGRALSSMLGREENALRNPSKDET